MLGFLIQSVGSASKLDVIIVIRSRNRGQTCPALVDNFVLVFVGAEVVMLICASVENAAMCGNAPDANEKKIEVGNVDIWINL